MTGVRAEPGRAVFVRLELSTEQPTDAAVYYEWLLGLAAGSRPGAALRGAGVDAVTAPPPGEPALGWIPVFQVESLAGAEERGRAAGATALVREVGGLARHYVDDPRGVRSGLTEAAVDPIPYWTTNVDYSAVEVAPVVDFFERMLEVEPLEVVDDPYAMTLMVRGRFVATGVLRLHGVAGFPERPFWIAYFGVDDLVLHVARAVESGSRVLVPPTGSPFNLYAVLEDPWGHVYGFSELPAPGDDRVLLRDRAGRVAERDERIDL